MDLQVDEVKEKIKERWNKSSETFDKSPGHSINSNIEKDIWKSILIDAVGTKPLKILDIGTGTGFIAILLTEMGHQVVGVDIAEDMLRQAQKKAKKLNYDVKFLIGDADNLPFKNETFDLVINRHVFWTMPKPKKAALEWSRVLKPGGKLVIIDGDWTHYDAWKIGWKVASNLAIWITEGKNPWDKSNSICAFEKELPMRNEKRPEKDINILNSLGMKAKAKNFKDPRAYGLLNNIKYGYYNRFVVTAVKQN